MRAIYSCLLVGVAAFGLSACYFAPPPGPSPVVGVAPPVAAYQPIPPLRPEYIPPAPAATVVWEPGHWHWNGYSYVWIGGHYVERARAGTRYIPGQWVQRGGAWVWVPAHWI